MKELCKIIYNDYEKISDICMWLSNDYVLKFTVELNKHNDKYGKSNFYKEIGYTIDEDYRVNINRDFIYYLSIESIKKTLDGNKLNIRIGLNDIYFLKYKLEQAILWFTDKYFENLFARDNNNKIVMTMKPNPIKIDLSFGNYIEIEPSIFTFDNTLEQLTGVRIYLSSDSNSLFMNINTLFGFKYFIDTFNMYQSAQNMLNFLGRPEYGTNYFEYSPVKSKQNEGFFNRINAKSNN